VAGLAAFGAAGAPPARADGHGWQADPAVVARNEAERPGFIYDEADVPPYTLPDPLRRLDGRRVTSAGEWPARRAELLELFRGHVYGRRPAAASHARHRFRVLEEDPSAMDGAATLKRVRISTDHGGRTHAFEVVLFVPNAVAGPAPVFLLLNNRGPENTDPTRATISPFWPAEQVVARGYAIAALQVRDLAPDDPATFTDGVIGLFEREGRTRPADAWAALSAWGWGGSRALDYVETDDDLDATRVAVVGHSRGGKAALWAGAEDERFALVVSNDSGAGGAALSRRIFGETVAEVNTTFPHWFCRGFQRFNGAEDELPVDQHELIALLAPRAVAVGSADEDLWADPRGEFLSLAHASPVYALFGGEPIPTDAMPALDDPLRVLPRQYHIRRGGHDLTTQDWGYYTDLADRLWG
uniref:glucuronyl esterase domain-containing protein n=1 Tax=Desertihabitans aurantiacus TaxID=2282477 RepID=UPI0018E554B3